MSEMKTDKKKELRKAVLTVVLYAAVITAVVFLFQRFLYAPMRVVGDSMNPALADKDILLVSKLAYEKGDPERFDLVGFYYKYDIHTMYIKRVIGLPGETVEIKNNTIYIDSEELKEYYGIYGEGQKRMEDYGPYTLKSDEYFVLGDNRDHSVDSRSGDVGPVERSMFIGKAAFRLWPFHAIGSLKYQ